MSGDGAAPKSATAFRTIGEVAAEIGVPQHVLRFWETRFTQVRPLQRGGNRRYYRPADITLLRDIHRMLHVEGLTIRGVQKRLDEGGPTPVPASIASPGGGGDSLTSSLRAIRDRLSTALELARAA